ncbi:hypothetical protein [Primorskyibacter sedentarius]|uniref:hypothetical protein n=1 Tax=Primorskyibacter sedentarius TaxID=745311 RepID=UPI003EB80B5B
MNDRTEEMLDYVHDRLDPEARQSFEADLSRDAHLRAELAVVQAVAREGAAPPPTAEARDAGWASLSAAIDADARRIPANDNRGFSLAQVATIAIVAVVITQFFTLSLWPDDPGAGFAPASQDTSGFVLQVGFAPEATAAQLTALLQELGATLVDGPGALGLVTLSFTDEAARTAALEALRAQPDLVEIVSQP